MPRSPSLFLSCFVALQPRKRSDQTLRKGHDTREMEWWNETHSCERDREEGKGDSEGPILRTIGGVQVSVVRPTVGTSVSAAI